MEQAMKKIVTQCLGMRLGESVLIIIDETTREIGRYFYQAVREWTSDVIVMEIPVSERDGQEPAGAVAEAMKHVEIIFMATARSLTHTRARREACQAGARLITLPGITAEVLKRTMQADYHAIKQRTLSLVEILNQASNVHITSSSGTDLRFCIHGRQGKANTGIFLEPGSGGNLPAGEAFIAPIEDSAEGTVVIDGSMAGFGMVQNEPITLTFQHGTVVSIQGGEKARKLEHLLDEVGPKARVIAELGIGTNDFAKLSGSVLEDEKVMGTIHIAIGNNIGFGGTNQVDLHLDGVVVQPTVLIDGKTIVQNGKLFLS